MTVKVKYGFYDDGSVQYKSWRNEKGEAHREDGPALEYSIGTRKWIKNEKLHRDDGPAIVWENGRHSYFLNGIFYTKEEYWKEIEKLRE